MPDPAPAQQLTITLPAEVAAIVQDHIASGEYASESDFVRDTILSFTDSLGPLPSEDDLIHWMNTAGADRLEALHADPSRGLTAHQAFAGLLDEANHPEQAK